SLVLHFLPRRHPTSTLFPYTSLFRSLRQTGPEFDHSKPLEQQSDWNEHAAYMDGLVEAGHIVLGGTLPDGATAHAFQAKSEEDRSEEHTSELQSPDHLVCRLLLEKQK